MSAVQLMAQINPDAAAAAGKTDVLAKSRKMDGVSASFSNYMQQPSDSGYAQAQPLNGQSVKRVESAQASESGRVEYEKRRSEAGARADRISDQQKGKEADTETTDAAVEEAAQEIRDMIAEELDADPEQIEEAMQLLGLTAADLLDPQKLMVLTMELTGTQDAAMMLFQEDFQNILQQVSVITENLLKDLGISMEDLQEILQQPEIQSPELQQTAETVETSFMEQTADAADVQTDVNMGVPETVEAVETMETAEAAEDSAIVQSKKEAVVQQESTIQTEKPQADATGELQTEKDAQQEKAAPVQQEETQDDGHALQQESAGNQRDTAAFENESREQHAFSFQTEGQQNVQNPVVQETQPSMPAPQVDVQDIIEQISRYVRVTVTEDVKSLEMQLNPESLGKIYLHISEHEGAVTAHLTAQNENVKEALVQQMAVLRENLEQQGVKVDAVEVSVGAHEFESNLEKDAHQEEEQARQQEEQAQRNARRSLRLDDLDDFSGMMTEEEALVAQIMRDNGNSVDYKA